MTFLSTQFWQQKRKFTQQSFKTFQKFFFKKKNTTKIKYTKSNQQENENYFSKEVRKSTEDPAGALH